MAMSQCVSRAKRIVTQTDVWDKRQRAKAKTKSKNKKQKAKNKGKRQKIKEESSGKREGTIRVEGKREEYERDMTT